MYTKYALGKVWGLLTSIDLYGCSEKINDPVAIKEYVVNLCDNVIHMNRYGDCVIEEFGKDELKGYSMVQLIETSCVTAHFSPNTDSAYIDVFSCADYDPEEVKEYTQKFFGAKKAKITTLARK